MIRMVCRWLIERAHDGHRPLPRWLTSIVGRDVVLQRYQQSLERLGRRLQADAGDWWRQTGGPLAADDQTSSISNVPLHVASSAIDPVVTSDGGRNERPVSRRLERSWVAIAVSVLFLAVGGWMVGRLMNGTEPSMSSQLATQAAHDQGGAETPPLKSIDPPNPVVSNARHSPESPARDDVKSASQRWWQQARNWVDDRKASPSRPLVVADWRRKVSVIRLSSASATHRAVDSLDRNVRSQPITVAAELQRGTRFFMRDVTRSATRILGVVAQGDAR